MCDGLNKCKLTHFNHQSVKLTLLSEFTFNLILYTYAL